MVKVQAIIDFTYKNYKQIKDLESKNIKQEGKIFYGDIFNVEDDEAKYLTGENKNKIVAVKVLEVIPINAEIQQKDNNITTKYGDTEITMSKDKIVLNNIELKQEKSKRKTSKRREN